MQREPRFCQHCGGGLETEQVEGRPRPRCSDCGVTVFEDPKLAAVTLVARDGKLALVRRGVEPHIGRWSFPSGFVDRGERVEDAAVRETLEETGLHVRLTGLVGLYSDTGQPVALAVYAAEVVCGELAAGHDAQGVAFFEIEDMPPLPFPHDYRILEDWKAFRAQCAPQQMQPSVGTQAAWRETSEGRIKT